jgi:aminodeoxyfutalosine synthase
MEINLAIVGRVQEGATLTAAEVDELAASDVLSLGMLADEVRRARIGDRVTFVRVHEWVAGQPIPPAAQEVRLSTMPDTADAAVEAIRAAHLAADGRRLTGFSLAEILSNAGDLTSLERILAEFRQAGLDSIVHAPVDITPDLSDALRLVFDAGLTIGCLSVQRPIGDRRTDLLIDMRSKTREFPQITTIAPLPRMQSTATPTTGYDDVRMVALARLVVSSAPHVQVDWSQYGPKLAQVALTFGADDLDRVSAIDDETLGRRRMAAEDVKRNIAAAGFSAVERAPRP